MSYSGSTNKARSHLQGHLGDRVHGPNFSPNRSLVFHVCWLMTYHRYLDEIKYQISTGETNKGLGYYAWESCIACVLVMYIRLTQENIWRLYFVETQLQMLWWIQILVSLPPFLIRMPTNRQFLLGGVPLTDISIIQGPVSIDYTLRIPVFEGAALKASFDWTEQVQMARMLFKRSSKKTGRLDIKRIHTWVDHSRVFERLQ